MNSDQGDADFVASNLPFELTEQFRMPNQQLLFENIGKGT